MKYAYPCAAIMVRLCIPVVLLFKLLIYMAFLFLVAYLIAFLIRPHEWFVLVNENSVIIRVSLILCMVFFAFTRQKNFNNPQFLLVTLLTFTVVTSLVASGWVGGAVIFGQEFVQQVLIPFVLVSGLLTSIGRQYFVFVVIICASLLMVLNGHVQVSNADGLGIIGNPVVREGSTSRISYLGYLSDPNDLGMFFTMTLPSIFLLKERVPAVARPLFWGAIMALLYGIYLTNSRGTLLATLALMALWFWRRFGTNKSIMLGLMLSPALLVVLSSFRAISAGDESSQGRLEAWYAGYQMFMSNPIFGVGQNSFMEYYEAHTAHNSFVLVLAELGLFGTLVWVGLLVITTISLINIAEKKFLSERLEETIDAKTMELIDREALIAKSLLYSFLAFMVTGFFLSRSYAPLLYIYLGMAAASLGRIELILPKDMEIINLKQAFKFTFAVTSMIILGIYVLVRMFL